MSTEHIGPLSRRTARGVAWSYAAFAVSKGLTLLATAILARLLTPEEFGVVGFATVAVTYLSIVQDVGLGGALIYERDRPRKSANVVFSWNLVLGLLLFIAGFLLSPVAAAFFEEPAVTPLLRVLSSTFLIAPFGAVHLVLLQRELDFRRKMLPDVGSALVKGIVSITLAFAGLGVWALVIGQLAGTLVSVVAAWVVAKWRPRIDFDLPLTKSLLGFGFPLFTVDLIYVVTGNVDYVIVGRVLGATALGIYTLAYRLPELLVLGVVSVLSRSLFPAFSKARESLAALQRGFLDSIRFVVIFTTPICIGLFICARQIVLVTLGPNWLEVVPILRVLAIFAWVRSLMSSDGDVYKALGRPGFLAKITGLRLMILVPALLVAAPHGLLAVSVAHLITTILDKSLRIYLIARRLGLKVMRIVAQFLPATISGLVLAGVAAIVLQTTNRMGDLVRLSATTLAGAITYMSCIWLLERESLHRILMLMRPMRAGDGATDSGGPM